MYDYHRATDEVRSNLLSNIQHGDVNSEMDEAYSENETDQNSDKLLRKLQYPKDRCNMVFLTFILFGLTGVLPWTFFATATEYWMYKLRDVNSTEPFDPRNKSDLQASFTSYLTLASVLPCPPLILLGVATNKRIRQYVRVIGSTLTMLLLFIVTVGLVITNTDNWQMVFVAVTLITVVLLNSASSFFQASTFAMAGVFHMSYMQAMMNGQAIGGILSSVTQIGTLAIGGSPEESALFYFVTGIIVIAISMVSYPFLKRQVYFRYYSGRLSLDDIVPFVNDSGSRTEMTSRAIVRKLGWLAYSGVATLFVTVVLFPSVCVLIVPSEASGHSPWTDKYFTAVVCFLLFNCSDFVGRSIAVWLPEIPEKGPWIPVLTTIRLAFIPLFMLCNAQPRHSLPVVFDSDAVYIVLICLLGVSNGYFCTLLMIVAPRRVSAEHKEAAAILMTFLMSVGVMAGAIASYAVIKLL